MKRYRFGQGFTLMELMIALVLLAVVVSLAVPSYNQFVIRTGRSEALETLLTTASCQERIYTRANAYDADACEGNSSSDKYVITVTTSNANQAFVATATPQGVQTQDTCGVLTISQTGGKTAAGESGAFASACWSGKHAVASGS